MNILWIKADLLVPLDKGGKLRTWHLLRNLAQRHSVTYLSFADADAGAVELEAMREVSDRTVLVKRTEAAKRSLRFYAGAAAHLIDPLPYAVAKYRSREFRQTVRGLLANDAFDVIVCDFLVPAVNFPHALPAPAVLFTHNVESEIWRRHAEARPDPVRRALFSVQYRRMLRFEGRTLARFDGILAVSEADRDTLLRLYRSSIRSPITVVPTGVDTTYYTPSPAPPASRTLVFTGSMDWLPNEDAMLFFCRDILPRIRAEEPSIRVSIVGRAPTPAIRALARDAAIDVTGRVDDVRPHVREAAVYIVPLRIGGGTRLKIFEAMAMGKAIVSTTVGAEGLPVVDGRHLVLADTPHAFAEAVVGLCRSEDQRRQLAQAARDLVVSRYDWSAVAGSLDEALGRAARTRSLGGEHSAAVPTSGAVRRAADGRTSLGLQQGS
jgi:sugar transferase (PEP-CTERM/EpsH1 system associated)